MGDRSGIEWTDATWNPVTGCSHVSEGCRFCYAETLSLRHGWSRLPWTAPNAAENVVLHPERLDRPLRWRKPRRIFVNSMSDLFHEQIPDEYIAGVFGVMALTRHHTFQVLTKRPQRMAEWVQQSTAYECVELLRLGAAGVEALTDPVDRAIEDWQNRRERRQRPGRWPLPNVCLGVSVEDQRWADERIPWLLRTPADVRFLSCEPLLGPVDLAAYLHPRSHLTDGHWHDGCPSCLRRRVDGGTGTVDWVIAGGESAGPADRALVRRCGNCGGGAPSSSCAYCQGQSWRPTPEALRWVRSLRDQCVEAGAAFLFKQWGGSHPKAGGRELDGRTWDEYPETAAQEPTVAHG